MNGDHEEFPVPDDRLGELLADAAPVTARSAEDWARIEARVVAAAALPLARRRRIGWSTPLAERARGFAAAAAVALLIMGGMVYATATPGGSFAEVSAELMELLGEEEVRSYFPGIDDTDRLLEAAFAAQ